ncbi:MAG TPA: prolipoprotein diacylglyceryl transferase family protein [Kofleriaceae bacterium]|nr:prolipoprotein diacylglyceryl transferase family protein [Kofleriaceae bacterium]
MLAPLLAALSAAVVAGGHGHALPFFTLHTLNLGPLPLQPFGILVASGVLIGAEVMRRYMLRFGVEEDDIRGLTMWLIVAGFAGAHLFDAFVYEHDRLSDDPLLILKVWDGISSYGGFIGGALGYVFFVWWKRLTPRLMADSSIVGLLVAFTIGRIGCTIVHDHIGRATTSSLGIDYPRREIEARHLISEFPGAGSVIRAHNVAMYELAYLLFVWAIVLPLAFGKRRYPAGIIAVLVALLYAPVRFFLEYYRLNTSDPRYAGFTFAQWCSIAAFAGAAYVAVRLWKTGAPALRIDELGGRPGGRLASLEALAKAKLKGTPPPAEVQRELEEEARSAPKDRKADKAEKGAKADQKAAKADAKAAKADEKAEDAED